MKYFLCILCSAFSFFAMSSPVPAQKSYFLSAVTALAQEASGFRNMLAGHALTLTEPPLDVAPFFIFEGGDLFQNQNETKQLDATWVLWFLSGGMDASIYDKEPIWMRAILAFVETEIQKVFSSKGSLEDVFSCEMYSVLRPEACLDLDKVYELSLLTVEEQYTAQKVGSAFLMLLVDKLRELGCDESDIKRFSYEVKQTMSRYS